jgi:hypothetical protein
MKIVALTLAVSASICANASALVVNEVMSNPTGDDSGREWIELYNDSSSETDLSSMTISIKGGAAIVTTPLQGGFVLPAGGYAIIGSNVSGATKFLQDYPAYSGLLFRSSISLVNTGVTSIDIRLNGSVAASLPSYTAAKEGTTLSYSAESYVSGTPTPGADNQVSETGGSPGSPTATTTETQATLPQMAPPSADIVIYMPVEKTVVAGAASEFSVLGATRAGKPISDLRYVWAFGDGGQSAGSSTSYTYVYSGRYIAQVEAASPTVVGKGRMAVRVVAPDIAISSLGSGKYGTYVDLHNPNDYDLDLSQWMLTIDGAAYPFPRNTMLPSRSQTRFSGLSMGFASTTVSTSTIARILFPNLEEVTRYVHPVEALAPIVVTATPKLPTRPAKMVSTSAPKIVLGTSTAARVQQSVLATGSAATTTVAARQSKDTRLVSWLKALFR